MKEELPYNIKHFFFSTYGSLKLIAVSATAKDPRKSCIIYVLCQIFIFM